MKKRNPQSNQQPRNRQPNPQSANPQSDNPRSAISTPQSWWALLVLCAALLIAYQPAWHGAMLWDDDGHLTRGDLASLSGLVRIWFEPGATQQYYPVLHSAFWVFNHLFGANTTGYHVVNILLHALSAWFLWRVLAHLAVPGALLAAVIFALHPVHVESVAWISELKNALSGAFYMAALLVYLRYDRERDRRTYGMALTLFVLAVLSKTVTVTLPAALLVIFWWQRGALRMREDVRPLLPFFGIGFAAGLMTIWMERTFIGAQGREFDLSLIERTLLAGRVVWFYASTLFWPADLSFVYPRWTIDASAAIQWIYPLALLALAALLWMLRGRTRAPLAVLLLFIGTLFPALGFFNVYPFRFSFVADHFQYLASIAIIAGVSAALVSRVRFAHVERAAAVVLAVVLGALTWRQAHAYAHPATLYRDTIARNPAAWLAHNNLASLLLAGEPPRERIDEAMQHLDVALRLKPDYAEAHYNLGTALERLGRRDEAADHYRQSLALEPGERRVLRRMAIVNHDRASALMEQGLAHENAGRLVEAERAYADAAALDATRAVIHASRGRVLQKQGRREDAVRAYKQALSRDNASFETHNDLGVLLAQLGRLAEAVKHFEAAVALRPDDPGARANLAQALDLLKR